MCNCKICIIIFLVSPKNVKTNIDVFQVDTQFRAFEPNEGPIYCTMGVLMHSCLNVHMYINII